MTASAAISLERGSVSAFVLSIFMVLLTVTLSAAGLPPVANFMLAALLAITLFSRLARRLPVQWDGLYSSHKWLCLLWLLLACVALTRLSGVALYMADATHAQFSAMWFDSAYINHSCFSGYWKGAMLAKEGIENIYDSDAFDGFEGNFKLDTFLYPPQFLILPQVGIALGGSFMQLRAIWFALDCALIMATMLALCITIGGAQARRAALLLPALFLATPTLLTLQTGNFQLASIALSVLAMMLFERKQNAAGGALLGFAAFKIFPGILCGYLLFTRRWRALAWTIAFTVIYSLVGYALFGGKPIYDFIHTELPLIASGELWSWLELDGLQGVVAINDSVPGLVLKLQQLGVPGMTRALMINVSWIWTLVVIALSIVAARRELRMSQLERAGMWIGLLGLAALRSPFVPDDYGLFPALWLWVLLAASIKVTRSHIVMLVLLWLSFAIVYPYAIEQAADAIPRLWLSSFSQMLAIALCTWAVLRTPTLAAREAVCTAAPINPLLTGTPVAEFNTAS